MITAWAWLPACVLPKPHQQAIVGAGLDHTGEYLLFTDEEEFGIGKMGREMPAGSTAQTRADVEYDSTLIIIAVSPSIVWSVARYIYRDESSGGRARPLDLHVDEAGRLFWSDIQHFFGGVGGVYVGSVDGSKQPVLIADAAAEMGGAMPVGVALDGDTLYYGCFGLAEGSATGVRAALWRAPPIVAPAWPQW